MELDDLVKQELHYVIKATVSPSPLRSQGPKRTVETLRKYLCRENWIDQLRGGDIDNYKYTLDKLTSGMSTCLKNLPNGSRNWGGPRKVLNILFTQICDRSRLSEYYNLKGLRPHLEAPLDRLMIEYLKRKTEEYDLHEKDRRWLDKWKGIKHCKKGLNKNIQRVAQEIADIQEIDRCDLDYIAWTDSLK